MAISLAITDEKEVNIWTFGNNANFEGRYGINKIDAIYNITCKGESTNLQCFVQKANDFIIDGSLCIIFTDDDSSSISAATESMKQRNKVFWQIIVYERDLHNIKTAIKNIKNTSVVSLTDYQSKTDEDINSLLLKDYIIWKQKGKK